MSLPSSLDVSAERKRKKSFDHFLAKKESTVKLDLVCGEVAIEQNVLLADDSGRKGGFIEKTSSLIATLPFLLWV